MLRLTPVIRAVVVVVVIALGTAGLSACGGDDGGVAGTPGAGFVRLTGWVTAVSNELADDSGVTLRIDERLHGIVYVYVEGHSFTGEFRPNYQALLTAILGVHVGDHITVTALPTGDSYQLESIDIIIRPRTTRVLGRTDLSSIRNGF